MSEPIQDEQLDELPESNIRPRSKFSIVWLVPLVAVIIGSWIGYKAWSERGPIITITFKTAKGLEAGKTKIKFKDVEIGEVKSILVNQDTFNVEVTAELHKEIKPMLTDQTRFWVVRARIDTSGASGLATLLSGAYIDVSPSKKGPPTTRFTGLEIPPVIAADTPGKHFFLHTKDLGSLERGVPIYYRKFSVGRVEDVKLDDDGESVTVRIFISAPYDQWVNTSTKFWNASGIDVSMGTDGLEVNTESLVSILVGGIAFESKEMAGDISAAENLAEFKLYADHKDSLKKELKLGINYVINFTESVRGLSIGAPVEFRGIPLGKVTDIRLSYNASSNKITIPVTVTLDYELIALKGEDETAEQIYAQHEKRTDYMVKKGLRAQLQTASLLTGQLFVAIDLFPDAPAFAMNWDAKTPEFPSVPGMLGGLELHASSILKKVDAMMTQIKEFSYKLNHQLEPELSDTLIETKKTLVTIQDTLQNDSPLQQDMQSTLRELTKAARSIKNLADYLERHPESLIKGKKGD